MSADAQRVEKVQYLKGLGFKPFPDSDIRNLSSKTLKRRHDIETHH